jgi:hypothetical protein
MIRYKRKRNKSRELDTTPLASETKKIRTESFAVFEPYLGDSHLEALKLTFVDCKQSTLKIKQSVLFSCSVRKPLSPIQCVNDANGRMRERRRVCVGYSRCSVCRDA